MITRLLPRAFDARQVLESVLGHDVGTGEPQPDGTVVACWLSLDAYDKPQSWTWSQWSDHLGDPLVEHPFAASPRGDRHAVLHLHVQLDPRDRILSGPEWAEIGRRLARAVGIDQPGDTRGCRWIALQSQPGRLDIIGNHIRLDGAWQQHPDALRRIVTETRRIEADLGLTVAARSAAFAAPADLSVPHQLAKVLRLLADEPSGPLTAMCGLVEDIAHRLAQCGDHRPGSERLLRHIVLQLHTVRANLAATAALLDNRPAKATRSAAPSAAAGRHTARASR
jgi:hypothetical protein